LICAVLDHILLLVMVSIFVGTGSVLQCWQILVFTSAYALNFINCRFGSLFWLPRVPIGSLFQEKLGPYWVPISKHGGPYKFGEQCIPVSHQCVSFWKINMKILNFASSLEMLVDITWCLVCERLRLGSNKPNCTVPKRVPILGTGSL